jgi:hypothetical protein
MTGGPFNASDGFGDADGLADPSLAKRAARSSAAEEGDLEGVESIEADGVVSRLTLDFLRALRRARRASSMFGSGMLRVEVGLGSYFEFGGLAINGVRLGKV